MTGAVSSILKSCLITAGTAAALIVGTGDTRADEDISRLITLARHEGAATFYSVVNPEAMFPISSLLITLVQVFHLWWKRF
jgi:hypothetical protein